MAHYPNDKGEYKTKPTLIKWYPSDLVKIDRRSKQLNLTRTEYIARCVLDSPVKKNHIFKVNWRTYSAIAEAGRELKRIGNNINQITKVFNQERLEGGKVPENYPLPEELSGIRRCINELSCELYQVRQLMVGHNQK